MSRQSFSSGSSWEPVIGYSRAVRVGSHIAVSGTTGVQADGTTPNDVADQTRRALEIIRDAVHALGGTLEHVVRTRMFMANIEDWQKVGAVHAEFFGTARPATTMVEVSRLISPELLIEIEADAIVED